MNRLGWIIAVVIVLAANGVGWICAAINRGGSPDAVVVLTERELPLAPREQEETGVALRLRWNRESSDDDWLDEKKMEELGFDPAVIGVEAEAEPPYWKLSSRRAYVVFDNLPPDDPVPDDGAMPGEGETEEAESKEDDLDSTSGSRLVAIDAGTDPVELRRRYPDRSRYVIVPAVIGVRGGSPLDAGAGEGAPVRRHGVILRLLSRRIHVPRSFHGALAPALESHPTPEEPQRYRVTLAFGRRFEPWIQAVEMVEP